MPVTRFLAFSQLIAAVLLVVGAFHSPWASDATFHISLYIAPVILAALSAMAGVTLLLREPLALYLTLLVQGLQIVNLGAPVRLVITAGLKVATVLSSNGLQLAFGLGGEAAFTLSPPDALLQGTGVALAGMVGWQNEPGATWHWSLAVNWVALFFAYYIWSRSDRIATEWSQGRVSASAI